MSGKARGDLCGHAAHLLGGVIVLQGPGIGRHLHNDEAVFHL